MTPLVSGAGRPWWDDSDTPGRPRQSIGDAHAWVWGSSDRAWGCARGVSGRMRLWRRAGCAWCMSGGRRRACRRTSCACCLASGGASTRYRICLKHTWTNCRGGTIAPTLYESVRACAATSAA